VAWKQITVKLGSKEYEAFSRAHEIQVHGQQGKLKPAKSISVEGENYPILGWEEDDRDDIITVTLKPDAGDNGDAESTEG
tara:strand:- start:1956 stop:2195 length:240 start_codon:yes stop_codon:yes gene_type:complete